MICRLCLQNLDREYCIPLFGSNGNYNQETVLDLITKYFQLEVAATDTISTMICRNCYRHLTEFYDFCNFVEQQQDSLYNKLTPCAVTGAEITAFVENSSDHLHKFEEVLVENETTWYDLPEEDAICASFIANKTEVSTIECCTTDVTKAENFGEILEVKKEFTLQLAGEESDSYAKYLCGNKTAKDVDEHKILDISIDSEYSKLMQKSEANAASLEDNGISGELETSVVATNTSQTAASSKKLKTRKSNQDERKKEQFVADHLKLKCEICEMPMDTFRELNEHSRKEHNYPGYVNCCGEHIKSLGKLVDHIKSHAHPELLTCKMCGKSFKTIIKLVVHMKDLHTKAVKEENDDDANLNGSSTTQNNTSVPDIPNCLKVTPKRKKPKKIRRKSRENPSAKDNFEMIIAKHMTLKCDKCQATIDTHTNLMKHFKEEHKCAGYVKCCGRQLANRTQLVDHLNWHTDPEYFKFCSNKTPIREVANLFNLSISCVHNTFNRVLSFFVEEVSPNVINFPKDDAEKEAIAKEFEKISGFPNVLGCIDGTFISTRTPKHKNKSTFVNRHDDVSITMQGICDSKLRFLDVFTGVPSKIDDSRVLKLSFIGKELPVICKPNYHLLGDSAYPLREYLLTPYRDYGNLTEPEKLFNSKLSQSRVKIVNAFGKLKSRFRKLMRLDFHDVEKMAKFVITCCALHNICIDRDDDWIEDISELDIQSDAENSESTTMQEETRESVLTELGKLKREQLKNVLWSSTPSVLDTKEFFR